MNPPLQLMVPLLGWTAAPLPSTGGSRVALSQTAGQDIGGPQRFWI